MQRRPSFFAKILILESNGWREIAIFRFLEFEIDHEMGMVMVIEQIHST